MGDLGLVVGSNGDEAGKPTLNDIQMLVKPNFAAFNFSEKKDGPKKLVIRNLRTTRERKAPTVDENWEIIKQSILAIQECRGTSTTFEKLYDLVDTMCKDGHYRLLYKNLETLLQSYLVTQAQSLRKRVDLMSTEMLTCMNELWECFSSQMDKIVSIFLVLDRVYVLPSRDLISIYDLGLRIFHVELLDEAGFGRCIGKVLSSEFNKERKGGKINSTDVRSCIRMLRALSVYEQLFEQIYLKQTTEFYRAEGEELASSVDIQAYCANAFQRLEEEKTRSLMYLIPPTHDAVIAVIDNELINAHIDMVIVRGLSILLDAERLDYIKALYLILGRINGGRNVLRVEFGNYIKKLGRSLVNNSERDSTMISDLMNLKVRMDKCLAECFADDVRMAQAEQDAFDFFINTRPTKPAELLAKFMDSHLRSGNKDSSEEEFDAVMSRAIQIFRFIQGKDIFEAFYKRDLSKRLLLGRSASFDAERGMLLRLRYECGSGFTHKLEGMFKDMEISQGLNNSFKQYVNTNKLCDRNDLTVNVLTCGMWPVYEPLEIVVPTDLSSMLQHYESFYASKHSSRKLKWQHSLGQALIKAQFKHGAKELQVSMFQAVVLLLFNSQEEWTVKQISEATKIPEKELAPIILSLSCAKHRILKKLKGGREIESDNVFCVNDDFRDKLHRIRVSQVQMKETFVDKKAIEAEVSQDRIYQMDAGIVRILKMRRRILHQNLLQELFSQLRFSVKASDVKVRINSLIERDYMARDSEDSSYYVYVS